MCVGAAPVCLISSLGFGARDGVWVVPGQHSAQRGFRGFDATTVVLRSRGENSSVRGSRLAPVFPRKERKERGEEREEGGGGVLLSWEVMSPDELYPVTLLLGCVRYYYFSHSSLSPSPLVTSPCDPCRNLVARILLPEWRRVTTRVGESGINNSSRQCFVRVSSNPESVPTRAAALSRKA